MGMNSADQAAVGGDWRGRLRKMRTLNALRGDAADAAVLGGLDPEALAAAAENPDHSEAGRAAAAAALAAQGGARWRLAVPGFISAADLGRGDRLFFSWGRRLRVWSGATVFLALIGVLALAFLEQISPGAAAFGLSAEQAGPLVGEAVLFAAAVWFVAVAFRRHPARVLVLRKFNTRALAAPLSRMIGSELRPYGHVIGLSDKFIRHDTFGWLSTAALSLSNPLAAVWFVVGMPVRLVWRLFDRSRMGPATVLDARDYRNLAGRLRDRIGLNLQVAFASQDAFLVRTSDAWWRLVARVLIASADVIVVDLSRVTEGTAWELDVIREESAAARCVFVALWGKAEEAQAALQRWGFANTCFYYAPDGEIQRRSQFRAATLDAIRASCGATA